MKEDKQIKIKKSFTQKVDLQMCRQRQRRKSRKEQFANLYKSRCSGLDTNELVLWLMLLIRYGLMIGELVRVCKSRGGG